MRILHNEAGIAIIAAMLALSVSFTASSTAAVETSKNGSKQLSIGEIKIFETDDPTVSPERKTEIAERIKAETGLERARPLTEKEKQKRLKAFNDGKSARYNVQELLDAGVFKFKPICNLHPNCPTSEDDKSVRPRDGNELEIDNAVWGKKKIPAVIVYGVMHSTEDGELGAAGTVDVWNKDCADGKRSSSTPFVVGRCLNGPDIYVTADFETRWQRHCSSKLTGIEPVVNWNSIGVEMEHDTQKKVDYTDAQMQAVARLWTYIQQRAKIPDEKIITHAELQGHLPKEHMSFRSDPEEFDWTKYAREIKTLRKKCKYKPAENKSSLTGADAETKQLPKGSFQKALESLMD